MKRAEKKKEKQGRKDNVHELIKKKKNKSPTIFTVISYSFGSEISTIFKIRNCSLDIFACHLSLAIGHGTQLILSFRSFNMNYMIKWKVLNK